MRIFKPLVKDIKNTWPFSNVSFPKSIKCKRAYLSSSGKDFYDGEISEAGVEFYDGDETSEGVYWKSAEYIGDYILVNFDCKEKFRGGPVKIKLRNLSFVSHPREIEDVNHLIDELTFVTEVVESGD